MALPTERPKKPKGVSPTGKSKSSTSTYNPSSRDQVLSMPAYYEHLRDLYQDRLAYDSKTLIEQLFVADPDISAAVNAYLTMANTFPLIRVRDANTGETDRDGHRLLLQTIRRMTRPNDYSQGYQFKLGLFSLFENMRYSVLLTGAVASELVVDPGMIPGELRLIDPNTVKWKEPDPGRYKPIQEVSGAAKPIDLDVPTFAIHYFRRNPKSLSTNSSFVAAINTVAARQAIINELYRIMQITGFPRLDVEVLEEVVLKNAPADVKRSADAQRQYLDSALGAIGGQLSGLRSDQAFVHYDSVKQTIINDKNPAAGLDISKVIDVLNAQNQAALKVVSAVIGRGESGVNTASVEARIFSLNADEINEPLAETLSAQLTLALNLQGRASYVDVEFRPAELRPTLELEPQFTMRAARLREDLSLGIISDEEYCLQMYDRLPLDGAPELSGTGFMQTPAGVDAGSVSPNSDPLGRSLTPEGSPSVKSNTVKKTPSAKENK